MTSVPRRLYEFGEFRLDPAERLLTRHDQPVELPPKAFDVLVFLVERHGRLVRKDEFLQELWPGTFVEEGTLKRHISALRKALGQNGGEDRYIETLPKAGYRFAAPVRTIERETLIPDAPRSEPEPRRLSVRRGTKWALTAAAIAIVGAVSTILLRTSAPASANADPGVADFPKRLTDNLGSDDFPDWSPDGKRIVFMSAREGKPDIYVMNADGTGLINLTANPASDACPSWSPDGRQIVFESDRPPGQGIYVMDADGGNVRRVAKSGGRAAWSPDGKRIAFMSGHEDRSEIYVVNAEGTDLTAITRNDVFDGTPAWSPDGTQIAFTRAVDADRDLEIFVMNADGTGGRRLTLSPGYDSVPAWSPDARQIAFQTSRYGGMEIAMMAADGSSLVRITHGGNRHNGEVAWSPDGTRLAFHSSRAGNLEIYVAEALPDTVRRCTSSAAGDLSPSWSADGSRLAFGSNRSGVMRIYAAACGAPAVGMDTGDGPAQQPLWSPRGNKLAFVSDRDGHWDVYVRAGRTLRNVTHGHYAWGGGMAWSPDGSQLAIVAKTGDARDIVILEGDGRFVRRFAYGAIEKRDLAWSPDGAQLAYAAGPHSDGRWNYEIYLIGTDGSSERRLTTHPSFDVQPSWSADGRRLVFLSERSGSSDVYVIDADGSGLRRVTYTPWPEDDPSWSPDGRRLALASSPSGNFDIYVYDVGTLLFGR